MEKGYDFVRVGRVGSVDPRLSKYPFLSAFVVLHLSPVCNSVYDSSIQFSFQTKRAHAGKSGNQNCERNSGIH